MEITPSDDVSTADSRPSADRLARTERHDRADQVDRAIDLDLDMDELWELVSTADGWSRWLTDSADVDVRPGAIGDVTEGDVTRRVRVDDVQHGRRVGFTWWSDDDPSGAATVELRIEDVSVSARRLHIVERRLLPATSAVSLHASTHTSAHASTHDSAICWETRLWLLGSCTMAMSLR